MNEEIKNFQEKIKSYWVLGSILLLAFLIRIVNINFNSPFLDEAVYVFLGRMFWTGQWQELAQNTSWVGGFPFLYPPISAAFYWLGEIIGSRFLNVILGTLSVYAIFRLTEELFPIKNKQESKNAATVAAALMATSAIPISASRIALYDALCVFLFLAGVVQISKAIFEGEKDNYIKAAIFLFLAFLTKYIAAIYIPLLLLITLFLAFKTKKGFVVNGILSYFWLPLAILLFIFTGSNFSSFFEFFSSKSSGQHAPIFEMISTYFKQSPVIFLAFVPSIIFIIKRKLASLAAVLVFGALWPILVHLIAGESLSSVQHSIFALIFMIPVIGILCAALIDKLKIAGVLIAAVLIFFNLLISVPKVKALESFWVNTNAASAFLKENVGGSERILTESEDPITIELDGIVDDENIVGPFDFTYQGVQGKAAYSWAVADGYFDFIELDQGFFSSDIKASIEAEIPKKYQLVFDDGKVKIWQVVKPL